MDSKEQVELEVDSFVSDLRSSTSQSLRMFLSQPQEFVRIGMGKKRIEFYNIEKREVFRRAADFLQHADERERKLIEMVKAERERADRAEERAEEAEEVESYDAEAANANNTIAIFDKSKIVDASVYERNAELERQRRNQTMMKRKLQKRVAYLEEKLNAIKTITGLSQRGRPCCDPNHDGERKRMKHRIDHLEARLATIRSLAVISDTRIRDMRAVRGDCGGASAEPSETETENQ